MVAPAAPAPVDVPAAAAPLEVELGVAVTEPALDAPFVEPCDAASPPALLAELAGDVLLPVCAEAKAVDASNAAATTAVIRNLDCIISFLRCSD
ncbi:hypothetical protein [Rhodopseudomonas palustris]|uniref:hypothetical protein n=1 Tax=Rhodopseudomonas palustris TaxID=1076 RepID=UPI00160460C4|nr:hypothetical protein [Rhodopseudomonas palustris]